MNEKELTNYFDKAIEKGFFSHAYLIEVDESYDTSICLNVIKKIIRKDHSADEYEKICYLIDNSNYDDLKIIKPDGNNIKKEQLLSLMREYKSKSLTDTNRFYIIENAEDLNASASNTILKFLEEPEPFIVAFLITKNINNVLETIVSRCQIINLNHNVTIEYDFELLKKYFDFLVTFEKEKEKSIVYLGELYYLKSDELSTVFHVWITIYMNLLSNKLNTLNFSETDIELLKKMVKMNDVIEKINLLTELKELLKYNVNTRLLLDKLFIGGD